MNQSFQLNSTNFLSARNFLYLNLLFYYLLNSLEFSFLTKICNKNGDALLPCSTRTTASVRVRFQIVGNGVIDNVRQIVNIETACGNVGGNQHVQILVTEFFHHIITLSLRQIAMKRIGIIAVRHQFFGNFLGLFTGTAENNSINIGIKICNTFQCNIAVLRAHHIGVMRNSNRTRILCPDCNFERIVHIVRRDSTNFVRHGC